LTEPVYSKWDHLHKNSK